MFRILPRAVQASNFSCSFPPCEVFRKHWRMADSTLLGLPPVAHFEESQGVARCEPEAFGKMSGSGLLSKIRRASSPFGNSALNAGPPVAENDRRHGRRSEGQSSSDTGRVGSSWNMIGPNAGFGRKRAAKVVSGGWGAPTDALDSTITSASPVGTSAGTSIVTCGFREW